MRIGILEADRTYETSRARAGGNDGSGHLDHSLERHEKTVRAVKTVLGGDGNETISIPVDRRLPSRLAAAQVDLVFNTYFGPARRQDQAYVAALMEFASIAFTGGDAACHFIGLSKPYSKQILSGLALPTPRFSVVNDAADAARCVKLSGMGFPMIVKASAEGEGIGLDVRSVVRSRDELEEAVARIVCTYSQPALVEEFMPGREFTIGVLDGASVQVLPILEILLDGEPTYSYEAKTGDTVEEVCPAQLSAEKAADMGHLAVRAGRAIGCRDFWRVDFRADARGAPLILEINTLPGLQPGYSDITKMAGPAGMSYAEIVRRIFDSAMLRIRRIPAAGKRAGGAGARGELSSSP